MNLPPLRVQGLGCNQGLGIRTLQIVQALLAEYGFTARKAKLIWRTVPYLLNPSSLQNLKTPETVQKHQKPCKP